VVLGDHGEGFGERHGERTSSFHGGNLYEEVGTVAVEPARRSVRARGG
jgi:hypothetical protein